MKKITIMGFDFYRIDSIMICKHKLIWFTVPENGEGSAKDTVQLSEDH